MQDVEAFWKGGDLDPESNVQFGEGGAGTFSDGKLTTGTHDPRLSQVMKTFVAAGAPEDILWQHKPHVGTDLLRQVVRLSGRRFYAMARFVLAIAWRASLSDHQLQEIVVAEGNSTYTMPCDALILAPGHSARDTFRMLRRRRGCHGTETLRHRGAYRAPAGPDQPGTVGEQWAAFPLWTISWCAICPRAGRPIRSASALGGRLWRRPPSLAAL